MIVKSSARLIASVDQALATRPRGAVEIRVRVRRIDAQRLDAEVRGVDLDPEHGASVPRWVCVARVVGRVDGLAVPGIACVISRCECEHENLIQRCTCKDTSVSVNIS